MKVVILAGGLGTRLAEQTDLRPKPMVEIGGIPIIWHIMQSYRQQGFGAFVVATGYRSGMIKKYFADYPLVAADIEVDMRTGLVRTLRQSNEDWSVQVVDTGLESLTGRRLKMLQPRLAAGSFMLTYGDGLSTVDLRGLLAFHRERGRIATLTAVRPPARFGALGLKGEMVSEFAEKPQVGEGWINGGFMVFEDAIFDLIPDDNCSLEGTVLPRLAAEGELAAYRHEGFWHSMDSLRDHRYLEHLWVTGEAPWRIS